MFDFLLRPYRRNFGRDKEYYRAIDDIFGFIPNNIELYKLALIHKSASFVLDDGTQMNNERLEYLGDAIIEAITSDYLYIEFPDHSEGFLTQLRSKIVSRQSLNGLAIKLGLDKLLVAHSGATISQKHIYGDAFEAMMGAIYLDQGYNFLNRLLINQIYGELLDMETLTEEETDFKSRLIEWCQKNHHTVKFLTRHGAENGLFVSTIRIDELEVGHGRGTSKKEAEQNAARMMASSVDDEACLRVLDRMDKIKTNNTPV
uniref:ribonuclease III n=1 Tax=Alistipes sp. TaxID=1872444 RepID=UPI0040567715